MQGIKNLISNYEMLKNIFTGKINGTVLENTDKSNIQDNKIVINTVFLDSIYSVIKLNIYS